MRIGILSGKIGNAAGTVMKARRTLRFDRGFANDRNRRSAGILTRRVGGLKCADSSHSPDGDGPLGSILSGQSLRLRAQYGNFQTLVGRSGGCAVNVFRISAETA
jgi:hypothetical protein